MFNYVLLLLTLLLYSCGGGGGSSPPSANGIQSQTISGLASKGAIDGASVTIYTAEDTNFNNSIGEGITNANGFYSVVLTSEYSGVVVVKTTSGSYNDEATGNTIFLGTNSLISVAEVATTTNTPIVITPLTDLAYKHLQGTTPTRDTILSANGFVASQFGLASVSITGVMPDDVTEATATNTDSGKYGTILAVFSQAIASSSTNVNNFISALSADLQDGNFDNTTNITTALQDIKTNPKIKHNEAVINSVSSTIASIYPPNITNAGSYFYLNNTAISSITFINTGGIATTWTISPSLTNGLLFHTTTGIISGTPTNISTNTTYTITVSNITGSDSANIYIAVKKPDIANLDSRNFIKDKYITELEFNNIGGLATTWTISPSLTNGLLFHTTTGIISGTPTIIGDATTYTIIASNITGSDSANIVIRIKPQAPDIANIANQTYIQSVAIIAINFNNTGGDITNWAINRALPSGLNFNNNTGEISGTPVVSSQLSEYIITASNISGSDIARVSILINPATPSVADISLVELVENIVIDNISFINTGGAASTWSISPSLPSGLALNTLTGVISGTPLGASNQQSYIITASNITGYDNASINILVKLPTPAISSVADKVFINGLLITSFSLTNNGGAVSTWSISPSLPGGLALNTLTGVISGTPNTTSNKTIYTITAANNSGTSSASFSITVNSSAPIIADIESKVYAKDKPINTISWTNSGGVATTWAINPQLPSGLVFSATTGEISGTPTIESARATYTITASNIIGSDNANIIITINQGLPNIGSLASQILFEKIAITSISFVNTGGIVATWSISPELPSSLIFSDGQISGIPATLSIAKNYTIIATNISGSDSASISIEIVPSSPNIISIARQDFIKDSTITNINWTNNGSDATTWSISPSLPSGLLFNTTTGEISGLSLVSSTLITYSITARNITGSDIATINIAISAALKISGEITPAVLIDVDSDTNDPEVVGVGNHTFSSAQEINNFFTVHGFVANSRPASGALANTGDIRDFYKVSLLAGQNINLHISDHAGIYNYTGDIDLWLYDSDYNLVDFSYSVSEFENMIAPEDGVYYIEVEAYSGRSKYALSLQSSSNSNGITNNSVDFVVNQSIISYMTTSTNNNISTQIPSFRLQQITPINNNQRVAQAKNYSEFEAELAIYNANSYDKYKTLHSIKDINIQSNTNSAQPNYIYRPLTTIPNDSHYRYQWHYNNIRLPEAWGITTGAASDRDIIVAVIDTGVFLAHTDLDGKFVPGYDFISNVSSAGDGDGIDDNPDDPGDGNVLGNSSWHGTHVAGTIGAKSNNNSGVAGVSWDAKIMPIRALGKQGGTGYDIIQSLLYAAGLANDSGTVPAQKADIINLSIGGGGYSQATQDVYTRVRNEGIIIIAAAGNDNNSLLFYPASYDGVVSVSAVDYNDNKAPYSNYGSEVDIAAPGGNTSADLNNDGYGDGVLSTLVNTSTGQRSSNYVFYQGTSMAAPHVAGVAALMRAVYPSLTPADFDSLLSQGLITNEAGESGRDDIYGHGIIDAYKATREALLLAQGGTIPLIPANIQLSPQQLNLGYDATGEFSIINTGEVSASIVSITTNTSWISVATKSIDSNKLGTYQISINRNGLSDGFYSGSVNFTTSIPSTLSLLVTINVGTGSNDSNIGNISVYLFDSSLTYVASVSITDIGGGRYSYSFENVAKGEYFVIAGSDIDYDKNICQLGENCGTYPVINAIEKVVIDENNLNNINFVVDILSSSYNDNTNGNNNITEMILKINK